MTAGQAAEPTAPVGEDRILLGLNTFGDVGEAPDGSQQPHAQECGKVGFNQRLEGFLHLNGRPRTFFGSDFRSDYASASSRARASTASSIGSVSLPVNVFCWLTW